MRCCLVPLVDENMTSTTINLNHSSSISIKLIVKPFCKLLNNGFHSIVDSWPGNVGSVFSQQLMVHKPETNNDSRPNPISSYELC